MTQRLFFQSLRTFPENHPARLAAGLFTGMVGCEWCGWRGEVGQSHLVGASLDGSVVRFSCTDPGCVQKLAKGFISPERDRTCGEV